MRELHKNCQASKTRVTKIKSGRAHYLAMDRGCTLKPAIHGPLNRSSRSRQSTTTSPGFGRRNIKHEPRPELLKIWVSRSYLRIEPDFRGRPYSL